MPLWQVALALWDYPAVRWLAPLLLLYGLWCGFVWRYQDRLIFPSPKLRGEAQAPPGGDVWHLDLDGGGSVPALWLPPAADGPPTVVVYFHGNGETTEQVVGLVEGYRHLGCGVLLPEYRGFGHADGTASQRALLDDAARFYDRLLTVPGVRPDRIVYHGRSLGGGVACGLAARRGPAGLVLESTFTSIAGFFRRMLVPGFLCRHPFRSDRVVREIDRPVLVIHGDRDMVVPVDDGRALARLAPRAEYVEFRAGHNDLPGLDGEAKYWDAVARLLQSAGALPAGAPIPPPAG